MEDQLLHELRRLRARAYGPGADLHEDPAALSRLHELEKLTRAPAPPSVPGPPLPPSRPESSVAPEPLASPAQSAIDDTVENPTEKEPTGARAGFRPKKRIALAWIASVAVAVLMTATVTGFVSRRIQADPREVAVLGIDPFAEWPGLFLDFTNDGVRESMSAPAGGTAFQAFHGLSVFSMQNAMFGYGAGQTCLMVLESTNIDSESTSFEGALFNGCAAGRFPATVEIVVSEDFQRLPEELLDEFPEGTGLQFILEGDEVVVLSDTR